MRKRLQNQSSTLHTSIKLKLQYRTLNIRKHISKKMFLAYTRTQQQRNRTKGTGWLLYRVPKDKQCPRFREQPWRCIVGNSYLHHLRFWQNSHYTAKKWNTWENEIEPERAKPWLTRGAINTNGPTTKQNHRTADHCTGKHDRRGSRPHH